MKDKTNGDPVNVTIDSCFGLFRPRYCGELLEFTSNSQQLHVHVQLLIWRTVYTRQASRLIYGPRVLKMLMEFVLIS